jgi:DNA-binding beta-propeller fold protein YncE
MGCIGSEWEHGEDILKGSCERGRALRLPVGVAVSPDGENIYVASEESDAVAVLDREPGGGALTQRRGASGCISATERRAPARKAEP